MFNESFFDRLVVEIQIGFLNAEVIPELSRYETESWVK